MMDLGRRIEAIDYSTVAAQLHERGHAVVEGLLTARECAALAGGFDSERGFRKQVVMERHRYGRGLYKYWDYPLPPLVQQLRQGLYPPLVPVANLWMAQLGLEPRFPDSLAALSRACRDSGQCKPTPLLLRYGTGDYNCLHQDIYGEIYFPLQAVVFLGEPGRDYSGGEFVITEQAARAQARVTVLSPGRGDLLVFSTRYRPVRGRRGFHRVAMKHGVAEVRGGRRHAMGVIFHDAAS
ncbi:2OG-Fe(II) oxygenase [Parahaliea mediterranea]|uniref:2OG-Fe(II) oxygenase n=1 Tax=Parahaliea mediterranea TaxID=651086 RepID=A0A939DH34_9GAMM|nr:2OG-Fe(II) oxygenase [Parahaliea mediterranea]MBN7797923.1 2OG-Fe(II) oxygenase [Parahaliea mediterranea]